MASAVLLQSLGNGEIQDSDGNALNGHEVYVYTRGSTTQVQVYSDAALSSPLAQPLITGAGGANPGGIPGYIAAGQAIDLFDATANQRQPAEPVAVADLEQVSRKDAASGYAGLDSTEHVPLAELPASVASGSPTTVDDQLSGQPAGSPTWKVVRATDWVASRQGMGTGSDDGVLLNNLLSSNATKRVVIDIPITIATTVILENGSFVDGFGYSGVVQSAVDSGANSAFMCFQNAGWGTSAPAHNITMKYLRIRQTQAMLGTESPYQACAAFRLVDDLVLDHFIGEGAMAALVVEGCSGYQLSHCRGSCNADSAFKVVWAGAAPLYDPAERGSLVDCWAENSGYALDGVTPVSGTLPLGSSFILTQSSVDMIGGGAINPAHQAIETGNSAYDLNITGFKAKADINGRIANLLIANVNRVKLNGVKCEAHNGAVAEINIDSAPGQSASHITVTGCEGINDDTTAGNLYTFLNVGRNTQHVKVSKCKSIGARFYIGNATSSDIMVEHSEAYGCAMSGFYFTASAGMTAKSLTAADNGYDTTQPAAYRCGIEFDSVPTDCRAADLMSKDTRSGAARTQQYGYYINNSTFEWEDGHASNNVLGALHTTNTVVLQGANNGTLVGGGGAKTALAYSASITPDATSSPWQTVTVTNATAFTINSPANPPDANHSIELTIEVLNSSGGAMGAITWNGIFKFPTGAWANPANGLHRFARFEWNGANWICTSLASADY